MMHTAHDDHRSSDGHATSVFARLYWSVRREIWEHRSIYIAPLAVAVVVLIGIFIHAVSLPELFRNISTKPVSAQRDLIAASYSAAAVVLMLTSALVGCFYCLDALYGERRDRSILFWKSLPVSDSIAVLSKVSIPLIVLPIFTFAVVMLVQLIVLVVSSIVLYGSGLDVTAYWSNLPFSQMPTGVLYFLAALALWYAPIYAWCLLVSCWAQRAVFVWAIAPVLALVAIERTAIKSGLFTELVTSRVVGLFSQAFSKTNEDNVIPDPLKLFSTPGLWIGLAIAAALTIAAIRLRRRRDPL
jgi:ABC-2 type transport system permease protein